MLIVWRFIVTAFCGSFDFAANDVQGETLDDTDVISYLFAAGYKIYVSLAGLLTYPCSWRLPPFFIESGWMPEHFRLSRKGSQQRELLPTIPGSFANPEARHSLLIPSRMNSGYRKPMLSKCMKYAAMKLHIFRKTYLKRSEIINLCSYNLLIT